MSAEIRSTYRVQLNRDFTFHEAAGIADYLTELGVSHMYCSPYLQAVPGSTHGYDVLDHTKLNDELGGDSGHRRMCAALDEHGLRHIVDIVPNHMAIASRANEWWWDVLANGPSSIYALFFDIDWEPPESRLRYTILMPILGDHYGRVLEAGELEVVRDGDWFVVRYFDHEFPLCPESIAALRAEPDVDAALRSLNADPDRMHEVLEQQHYRLAYWKTARQEVGYRRFFDIDTLVGLRQEEEMVFEKTHRLIVDLVLAGVVDGLRVDHVDGLRDPAAYLERLRSHVRGGSIWVEKILEAEETLPKWPVEGTTGYEFLARTAGLFVDARNEGAMTEIYETFTGKSSGVEELLHAAKLMVARELLASDVERLTELLVGICERNRLYRDYPRRELRDAIAETIAAMPVYRTYVKPGTEPSATDADRIESSTTIASKRRPDLDPELFGFVRELLLLGHPGALETDFALRFQQTTGPAMAKSLEDTVMYRYNRLVSLNDVGSDPGRFGTSVADWHYTNETVQGQWPLTLLATSTHDTKRSEDVRTRISLLSEIPDLWRATVARWSEMNERHRIGGMPDRNIEYLYYQTLVGAHPLGINRAIDYMTKAVKEAKEHTSWVDPDEGYEDAVRAFVSGSLTDPEFLTELGGFADRLVHPGRMTSLAQVLLKLTAPGVPDIYQGTEVWDLSLVDPDNRRPVDYDARRDLLSFVRSASAAEVWSRADEGAPKMWLIHRCLGLRAKRPHAFGPDAAYRPLVASGTKAGHVVAFDRGDVVAVAPRLVIGLDGDWADTTIALPEGAWVDELTGNTVGGLVRLAALLANFPVALLARAR